MNITNSTLCHDLIPKVNSNENKTIFSILVRIIRHKFTVASIPMANFKFLRPRGYPFTNLTLNFTVCFIARVTKGPSQM